jgi:hypothetical protein
MQKLVFYLMGPLIPVLSVAVFSTLGSSRLAHMDSYADPFAPYEGMMPGQWMGTPGDLPCDFQLIPGSVEVTDCETHRSNGPFVSVTSSVFGGRVVRTWFRANNLYIGDIVQHWGRPDVVVRYNDRSFYVLWGSQGLMGIIAPVGAIGSFNYMLPVENFTISLIPNAGP